MSLFARLLNQGVAGTTPTRMPRSTCDVCYEQVPKWSTHRIKRCRHVWCRACLAKAFDQAVKSEQEWPPRCCGIRIPVTAVKKLLGARLYELYVGKSFEWGTGDRTYCHEPTCSTFIVLEGPKDVEESRVAECPTCLRLTCRVCKSEYHEKSDCDLEVAEEYQRDALLFAQQYGLKQCPDCHRLVENISGCSRVKCFCGEEFCYACGTCGGTLCNCPEKYPISIIEERLGALNVTPSASSTLKEVSQAVVTEVKSIVAEFGPTSSLEAYTTTLKRIQKEDRCHHKHIKEIGGGTCGECYLWTRVGLRKCTDCEFEACWSCSDHWDEECIASSVVMEDEIVR